MPLIIADRVRETSTTTGTGSYTLAGAVAGFRAFAAVCANADTAYYVATGGADWEVGLGTWATGGTLARTAILASSNGGAAVNWGAGTRDVFLTAPAQLLSRINQLYADTAPNATVPVMILRPDTNQRSEANIDVAVAPRGTGALVAQVPDGTTAGGNKRGTRAVDWQMQRFFAAGVAGGAYSVIGGGNNNRASGDTSCTLAGESQLASGTYSLIAGGQNNTASSNHAMVVGGASNEASNQYAVIVGGANNSASGIFATIGGGQFNLADGEGATIPGGIRATTRAVYGRLSYASGQFGSRGDAQYGLHVLRRATTDATATALTANANAPATTNVPVLPNNGLYAFRARVVCIQTGGAAGTAGDSKAWDVVGAIKRGANAGTTALLGTPTITVLGADTALGADNTTGATIAIVANATQGGLGIDVTGAANKNLRWVATVETTEVAY